MMYKGDYLKAVLEYKREYKEKKAALDMEYAMANNPYKVDDILQSDYGVLIRVKSIGVYLGGEYPQCEYTGPELKKSSLMPKKSGKACTFIQSRVLGRVIGCRSRDAALVEEIKKRIEDGREREEPFGLEREEPFGLEREGSERGGTPVEGGGDQQENQ
jgi:hypothetical protein